MSRRPRDTASARSHTNLPLATVHTRLRQLATAFAIAIAIASAATFAFAFAAFTILAPGTAVTAVTHTTQQRHPPGATPRTLRL